MVGECTIFMWSAHRTPKNQCVCVFVPSMNFCSRPSVSFVFTSSCQTFTLRLCTFIGLICGMVRLYTSVSVKYLLFSGWTHTVPECEHNLSNLVNEPVLVCNFGCTNNSTKVFYMYACTGSLGLCCTVWQLFGAKGPFLCLCFDCESMHIVARSKYTCNCGKDSSCEVCTLCSEHVVYACVIQYGLHIFVRITSETAGIRSVLARVGVLVFVCGWYVIGSDIWLPTGNVFCSCVLFNLAQKK